MIVIDLNGDGNLTDEFNAGILGEYIKYYCIPVIASTTSVHNFRNNLTSLVILQEQHLVRN
jgi:hypothetical protein